MALHRTAHSFNELYRPLCHDKAVILEVEVLISYLFNTYYYMYVSLSLPVDSVTLTPLICIGLFSISMCLFLLCK